MKQIKLIALLIILGLAGVFSFNSRQFSAQAESDNILNEIAKYKTWTKVSKEPIKVDLSIGANLAGG